MLTFFVVVFVEDIAIVFKFDLIWFELIEESENLKEH